MLKGGKLSTLDQIRYIAILDINYFRKQNTELNRWDLCSTSIQHRSGEKLSILHEQVQSRDANRMSKDSNSFLSGTSFSASPTRDSIGQFQNCPHHPGPQILLLPTCPCNPTTFSGFFSHSCKNNSIIPKHSRCIHHSKHITTSPHRSSDNHTHTFGFVSAIMNSYEYLCPFPCCAPWFAQGTGCFSS